MWTPETQSFFGVPNSPTLDSAFGPLMSSREFTRASIEQRPESSKISPVGPVVTQEVIACPVREPSISPPMQLERVGRPPPHSAWDWAAKDYAADGELLSRGMLIRAMS